MRLRGDPYMDAGVEGWIVNFASKNYWRVEGLMDLEDLIAEGYLAYYRCFRHYPALTRKKKPNKDDRRRFMALVKAAFRNRVTTLAWKRTEMQQDVSIEEVPDEVAARPTYSEGPLNVLLTNAPAEIGEILGVFVKDAMEGGGYLRHRFYEAGKRVRISRRPIRETTDEKISRLLGRQERNCVARVRAWIGQGTVFPYASKEAMIHHVREEE